MDRPLMVDVHGVAFLWTPGAGLDPCAVLQLDPMIRAAAWRHRLAGAKAGHDLDDLRQAGYVGALEAARGFVPGRGAFASYAAPKVRGAIVDTVRGARGGNSYARQIGISLDSLLDNNGDPLAWSIADCADGALDTLLAAESRGNARRTVRRLFERLSRAQALLLAKWALGLRDSGWGERGANARLGAEMGISERAADARRKRALWTARRVLAAMTADCVEAA